MSWREFVTWGDFFDDKLDEQREAEGRPPNRFDSDRDIVHPDAMTKTDVARIFGVSVR
jgi:hypothetical protein